MFIIRITETTSRSNESSEAEVKVKYIGKKGRVLSENKLPSPWFYKYEAFETKRAATRQMELEKDFYERYKRPKGNITCDFEVMKFSVEF